MPFNIEQDEDFSERRRLELRYRSAQSALAEARVLYASLTEMPGATDLQRHQAALRVQRAARQMLDAIDLLDLREWGGRARL